MEEIRNGLEVVDQATFADLFLYIQEQYGENDGEMLKAYIAIRAICAIIEDALDVPHFEVKIEKEDE